MHILESYALQNDLKIDKPHLYEKFFPLAVEKYITIDTSGLGTNAMQYDHWQLVVDLIEPKLKELDIKIIQMGEKDCKPLNKCYLTIGQCSFNQKAYVIKRSLVHISSNNETSHIASAYNKKLITLFTHNCHTSQFNPYWSDKGRVKLIQEKVTGKPSFNPSENPKSINLISPEKIAAEILAFSGIHTFVAEHNTLRVGSSFYQPRIESTLTHLIDVRKLSVSSLIARMDLNFNEDNLAKQLSCCPCSIITNKAISPSLINTYHKNIAEIVYYIQDDNDLEFVKNIKSKSINFLLRTRKQGEEYDDIKLKYLDFSMVHQIGSKSQSDFKELKDKNNLFYKSKYFIIHNNKFYPCTAAMLRDVQATDRMEHKPHEIIDDPLFWEDEEHFQFLRKK